MDAVFNVKRIYGIDLDYNSRRPMGKIGNVL